MILKNNTEIDIMRTNNKILAELLLKLKEIITEGITPLDIDKIADEYIRKKGGYPGFKGYNGFPNAVCASVNEQVIHGIPTNKPLKNGDIIGIDIGIKKNNFWGDAAYTYRIGHITEEIDKLCRVTEECLYLGIRKAVLGNRLYDISSEIQNHAESHGFTVIREFVGHGIGRDLWEKPKVPNYGKAGYGPRLMEGLVIAIEPMVNIGKANVEVLADGWTVVTKDRKYSAHYEHTIVITKNGPEILSKI